MKSCLNTIRDGIVSISANTNKNFPEEAGQTLLDGNPTEVTTQEDININPDHIEVVSVEIVNENDDSFASADDQVPEVSTVTERSPHHHVHNLN